jgi:hypothetical protein
MHRLLQRQLFRTNGLKLAVIAGVGFNRLKLDVGDVGAEAVEEVTVM